MYFHFTSSWWVIPLFLAILFIYLCLCCKRNKRSEEMEESWEDAHPSSPDQHPYGSNTLFAPRPPALPSSNYDWGQKEENQCYQIPLPPPYDTVSDVVESGVHWRSDFQIGSRVLKICFKPIFMHIYGMQYDFMHRSC